MKSKKKKNQAFQTAQKGIFFSAADLTGSSKRLSFLSGWPSSGNYNNSTFYWGKTWVCCSACFHRPLFGTGSLCLLRTRRCWAEGGEVKGEIMKTGSAVARSTRLSFISSPHSFFIQEGDTICSQPKGPQRTIDFLSHCQALLLQSSTACKLDQSSAGPTDKQTSCL